MMVLKFALGVRVVITTANFIEQDVTSKTQGVWYQEFPLRESATCDFEVRVFLHVTRLCIFSLLLLFQVPFVQASFGTSAC